MQHGMYAVKQHEYHILSGVRLTEACRKNGGHHVYLYLETTFDSIELTFEPVTQRAQFLKHGCIQVNMQVYRYGRTPNPSPNPHQIAV
jgi:hypothetical protein